MSCRSSRDTTESLLRLLNRPDRVPPSEPGGTPAESVTPHHRRRYGPDVVEALLPLQAERMRSGASLARNLRVISGPWPTS
jgi:hypothetical protein